MGNRSPNKKVLIIGGGPGGLAAAAACRHMGIPYLLVEAGRSIAQRSHVDQANLTVGVGGAGLYSDGKFSFYPSATHLWELPDRDAISAGHAWLSSLTDELGLRIPELPQRHLGILANSQVGVGIELKSYPSEYMALSDRQKLIVNLEAGCGESILLDAMADRLEYDVPSASYRCEISRVGRTEATTVSGTATVFAGGRFGATQWTTLFPEAPQAFRRLEVGVRLEQRSDDFFLRDHAALDPKLILRSDDTRYTWRTFCCCRNGETVVTAAYGMTTVSGRGDCGPTGRSNVGFNLLVRDSALGTELWRELKALNAKFRNNMPRTQPLSEFLALPPSAQSGAPVVEVLGVRTSEFLAEGLNLLAHHFPRLRTADCKIIAPTLEGVANYTKVNENLQVAPYPLWVAGDATGVFRGLTAALVSGYYAGVQAAKL